MTKPLVVSRETVLPVSIEDCFYQTGADEIDYPVGSPERFTLEGFVVSAAQWVENYTGRTIVGTVFEFALDSFPLAGGEIRLPVTPFIELVSIAYDDLSGEVQTFDLSLVDVDGRGDMLRIVPEAGWPIAQKKFNAVRVRVRAGYVAGEDNNLPAPLRIPILLLVKHYRDNASALSPVDLKAIPMGVESHCDQYRVDWL